LIFIYCKESLQVCSAHVAKLIGSRKQIRGDKSRHSRRRALAPKLVSCRVQSEAKKAGPAPQPVLIFGGADLVRQRREFICKPKKGASAEKRAQIYFLAAADKCARATVNTQLFDLLVTSFIFCSVNK
jgi:hypothetical protein